MSRLPGNSLLSSFDKHVADYNAEVDEIDRTIAGIERDIAAANAHREETYVALAALYCENREKFERELTAVSRELQGYFDEKAKRRTAVEEDLVRCRQIMTQTNQDLSAARVARDIAAQERDRIAAVVEAALQSEPAFRNLVTEREFLNGKADSLRKEGEALQAEAKAKLAGYDGNMFFRYLLERKYGTEHYEGKGSTARVDGWLAGKVDWTRNFPNYCILRELPVYSAKAIAEVERSIELLVARLTLRTKEAQQQHGFDDAVLKYDRRVHTVEELERRLAQMETQFQLFSAERSALETNRDPFIVKAKDAIKSMLRSESVRELRARAERTQDPRDNELVEKLEAAELAINNGRREIPRLRSKRQEAETQRQRVQEARRKFASDYTGIYDRFDRSVNLDQLIAGYLLGQTSERTFWSEIDGHRHDERPQAGHSSWESSSWGGGDASGGSSSFGGGDSGGGSSFGGGDSGGGSSFGGGD